MLYLVEFDEGSSIFKMIFDFHATKVFGKIAVFSMMAIYRRCDHELKLAPSTSTSISFTIYHFTPWLSGPLGRRRISKKGERFFKVSDRQRTCTKDEYRFKALPLLLIPF